MGAWTVIFGTYGGSPAPTATGVYSVAFASSEPGVAFDSIQPGVAFNGELTVGIVNRLSDSAPEEGTFAVTATFTDEDGAALTPDTLTWTLATTGGVIVNSRQDEVITPAASVEIVLSGDDLALFTDDNRRRRLTIEGTFTSDLGAGLPLTAECEFLISSFVGVT